MQACGWPRLFLIGNALCQGLPELGSELFEQVTLQVARVDAPEIDLQRMDPVNVLRPAELATAPIDERRDPLTVDAAELALQCPRRAWVSVGYLQLQDLAPDLVLLVAQTGLARVAAEGRSPKPSSATARSIPTRCCPMPESGGGPAMVRSMPSRS